MWPVTSSNPSHDAITVDNKSSNLSSHTFVSRMNSYRSIVSIKSLLILFFPGNSSHRCSNSVSKFILLLAIISRVFQLILVKLLIFLYNNASRCSLGFSCRVNLYSTLGLRTRITTWLTAREIVQDLSSFLFHTVIIIIIIIIINFNFLEIERRKRFCNRQNWNREFSAPLCVCVCFVYISSF